MLDERDFQNAVADTEAEIFEDATSSDSAFAKTSAEFSEGKPMPAGDRSLEEVQGWNNESLTAEQQVDATQRYHDDIAREQREYEATFAENEALKAEISRLQADPDVVARQQEFARLQRERADVELANAAMTNPDGLRASIQQAAQQQAAFIRTNETMAEARATHGQDFDRAFSKLMRFGEAEKAEFGGSPTVARIMAHPNPGAALMHWSANTGEREQSVPFMGHRAPASPQKNPEAISSGWSDRGADLGTDAEVWDSVWR